MIAITAPQMKTIKELSAETGIPKKTLFSRITMLGITPKMVKNHFLINKSQEEDILRVNTTSRIVIPKPSKRLIFEFKERYPVVANYEIAEILGIAQSYVDTVFGTEFLILESKMNYVKSN